MPRSLILIIDDEPSNLATLRQVLAQDYELVFARSGREGLVAARKHQPALVLLDIGMPDMDGYTVCRQLKADPLTEHMPVIFVSALGEVDDEAAGFDCGGVDYIVKPVSPALVRARVRTHLSLVRASTLERYVEQLEVQQQKIARLNRIKTVLSDINSAIVRMRERGLLFAEVCRIAVEHGGFGCAWIGLLDGDGLAMTAQAYQGIELDRLLGLLAGQAQQAPLGGQSLAAQAMQTGHASYSNDLSQAVQTDALGRDALAHGYLSMIALPLIPWSKPIGAIVLYARDAGYVDEDELKLLNELAGDIAFALKHIEQEERVNYLSYYDVLTGLPNHSLFLDRLGQMVQQAARTDGQVLVAVVNLDRFKQVNDALGRHVGDQVLRIAGERLRSDLSLPLSVARLAGDSFALAANYTETSEVAALVTQVDELLGRPMQLNGAELHLSIHLGLARYPLDGQDAESLFKNAEAALKQARVGGERHSSYSPELNARMAEKIELEQMLRTALEQQQFVLHYQPKVDLLTGRIASAEALIRWRHPERGMVPPADFIALAEETGLIVPIGDWVIRAVCAQQAVWKAKFLLIVPVALNLSALQFRKGRVLETVQDALAAHDLAADAVELELTETLVMQNLQEAERSMRDFHDMGLRLALDDFGTGYSSLAYLKHFPFDSVKIDRAFVIDVTSNPDDAAIASAIIAMAHSLRMHVVAEGVETEAQLKFLRSKGCDQIQGYYFSRPVQADDFELMLRAGKHLPADLEREDMRQTLLVVDDEEALRAALGRALRGENYRILSASSSDEALELLATHAVQVILCEHHGPGLSGAHFLAIAARLYPDTMRIILSGHAELQSVLDAVNRGDIYRFLTKPWDDELLRQTVRDAFRRYRPSAGPACLSPQRSATLPRC